MSIPHSFELEQTCLSLCMKTPANHNHAIREGLTEKDFYKNEHKEIWLAMSSLAAKGVDTAMENLVNEAPNHLGLIMNLGTMESFTTNPAYQFKSLKNYGLKREGILKAHALIKSLQNTDLIDIEDTRRALAEGTYNLQKTEGKGLKIIRARELMINTVDAMEKDCMASDEGKAIGISTGIPKLDENLGGLVPGRLYYIGARPGVGKTTLGLNILLSALLQGKSCLFLTIEMTPVELGKKLLSLHGKILTQKVINGDMTSEERDRFVYAARDLINKNLIVMDEFNCDPRNIKSLVKMLMDTDSLELVFIDYIQLLEWKGAKERTDTFTKISNYLKKDIAKSLHIPLVVMSQLNREGQSRIDLNNRFNNIPKVSQLKESGALEQDGDAIILLHRQYIYDQKAQFENEMLISVGKNRWGKTGVIETGCDLAYNYIGDLK